MTDEDMIALGKKAAASHLHLIETAFGQRALLAFAGGMASGVRNHVANRHGARSAYDLCQVLADDLIEQVRP